MCDLTKKYRLSDHGTDIPCVAIIFVTCGNQKRAKYPKNIPCFWCNGIFCSSIVPYRRLISDCCARNIPIDQPWSSASCTQKNWLENRRHRFKTRQTLLLSYPKILMGLSNPLLDKMLNRWCWSIILEDHQYWTIGICSNFWSNHFQTSIFCQLLDYRTIETITIISNDSPVPAGGARCGSSGWSNAWSPGDGEGPSDAQIAIEQGHWLFVEPLPRTDPC